MAEGPAAEVFGQPRHPYLVKLLASVPQLRVGWLDEILRKAGRFRAAEGVR